MLVPFLSLLEMSIVDHLGDDKSKLVVIKYDRKFLIPLFVKCNNFLNIHVVSVGFSLAICTSNSFFDNLILSVNEGLFSSKFFFHHCVMNLSFDARSPLLWWEEHVRLYSNLAFLAR